MKQRVERPFANCCAEGGGRIEYCDCVNKDHGTAWFEVRVSPADAVGPFSDRAHGQWHPGDDA